MSDSAYQLYNNCVNFLWSHCNYPNSCSHDSAKQVDEDLRAIPCHGLYYGDKALKFVALKALDEYNSWATDTRSILENHYWEIAGYTYAFLSLYNPLYKSIWNLGSAQKTSYCPRIFNCVKKALWITTNLAVYGATLGFSVALVHNSRNPRYQDTGITSLAIGVLALGSYINYRVELRKFEVAKQAKKIEIEQAKQAEQAEQPDQTQGVSSIPVLSKDPIENLYLLGMMLENTEHFEEATKVYTTAAESDHEPSMERLVIIYKQLENFVNAEYYESLIRVKRESKTQDCRP